MYGKAQVVIDLEEYTDLKNMIVQLSAPSSEGDLNSAELQEAIGLLLHRALENPRLFTVMPGEVPLGKYKAIFAWLTTATTGKPGTEIKVKLVRT